MARRAAVAVALALALLVEEARATSAPDPAGFSEGDVFGRDIVPDGVVRDKPAFVAGDVDGTAAETGRHAKYFLPSGKKVYVDTRSWLARILPQDRKVVEPPPVARKARDYMPEHPPSAGLEGIRERIRAKTLGAAAGGVNASVRDELAREYELADRALPIGCETTDQMRPNSYSFEGDEREYYVHLPPSYCGSAEHQDDEAFKLPTMMLLHCFGCTPQVTLDAFAPIADAWGFAIVLPMGTGSPASWNAEVCCGSALKDGKNDVGFINHLALHVTAVHRALSADTMFAVGHSNGAMLATLLAKHPPTGGSPFLAVQAWGGTTYDGFNDMANPVPFMFIHATNDAQVSDQGCCTRNACCCGISGNHRGACQSTMDVFTAWGRQGNGCEGYMMTSFERDEPRLEELKLEAGWKRSIEANETSLAHGERMFRGDKETSRVSPAFRCRTFMNCAFMGRDGTRRTEGSGRASLMSVKRRTVHYGGLNNATYCAVDGVGHRFDEAAIFHANRDRMRQRVSYFGAVGDSLWYQAMRFLAERSCAVAGGAYEVAHDFPPKDKCKCPDKPVAMVPVGTTGWRADDPEGNFDHVLFTGRWCTERRLEGVGANDAKRREELANADEATYDQAAGNLKAAARLDPGTYGHMQAAHARSRAGKAGGGSDGEGSQRGSRDLAIAIVEVVLGLIVSALLIAALLRCTRGRGETPLMSAGRV